MNQEDITGVMWDSLQEWRKNQLEMKHDCSIRSVDVRKYERRINELEVELKKSINESIDIIHDLGADKIVLTERVKKLEKTIRQFIADYSYAHRDVDRLISSEIAVSKFKQLLEEK